MCVPLPRRRGTSSRLRGQSLGLEKTTEVSMCACHADQTDARYSLARKNPLILPRMPNRMRKAQHQRPAERLAQRVMAITPLF